MLWTKVLSLLKRALITLLKLPFKRPHIKFILLVIPCSLFAQTDSLQIKLERYKDLYEKGLISQPEYAVLKQKELNLSNNPVKKDTVSIKELKRLYRSQYVLGSLEFGAALGFIGGFASSRIHANDAAMYSPNKYSDYVKQGRIFLVLSGICAGIGIYTLTRGAKNRNKYLERIKLTPASVNVSF